MTYLIDGYNLMHHSMADTPDQVVAMVNDYCHRVQKQSIIFFDGSAPDYDLPYANARFVGDADAALAEYVHTEVLNPTAYAVITSDKDVRYAGRDARLEVIPSDVFAKMIAAAPVEAIDDDEKEEVNLNDAQVARQLADFNFFKKKK